MAKIIDDELLLIISRLPDRPWGVPIYNAVCAHVGASRWLRIAPEWRVSVAWMYPALRRLEDEGFLSSYRSLETFPERGNRPRHYYRLTDRGTRRVERYLATRVPVKEIDGYLAVAAT